MRTTSSLLVFAAAVVATIPAGAQTIAGVNVTPHRQSPALKWRRPPDPDLAARVELFLQNQNRMPITISGSETLLFDGKSPENLISSSSWAWHDSPRSWLEESVQLPPDCVGVIAFNGRSTEWGVGTKHTVQIGDENPPTPFSLDAPKSWLSAVTFLSVDGNGRSADSIHPNQIVVHVQNAGRRNLAFRSLRLWLPDEEATHHVFRLKREFTELDPFPASGSVNGPGKAGIVVTCDPLPLSYAVVELRVTSDGQQERSLWGHLRIKRDVFDISGGWIASDVGGRNSLTIEEYLKTLGSFLAEKDTR